MSVLFHAAGASVSTNLDQRLVQSATGWLELGLPNDAEEELQHLPWEYQVLPPILALRWRIHAAKYEWAQCLRFAEKYLKAEPNGIFGWVHRSYALAKMGKSAEAATSLLPSLALFPKEWIIPYNLACQYCNLGQHLDAKKYLAMAVRLHSGKDFKQVILSDDDLKPFHSWLADFWTSGCRNDLE